MKIQYNFSKSHKLYVGLHTRNERRAGFNPQVLAGWVNFSFGHAGQFSGAGRVPEVRVDYEFIVYSEES